MSDLSMSAASISDLNKGILLFVIQSIEKGEFRLLQEVGFTQDQIANISKLGLRELNLLTSRRTSVFSLRVDTQKLDIILKDIVQERLSEQCILAGAPNDFLQFYFGLNSRDCSVRRTALGFNARGEQRALSNQREDKIIIDHYVAILEELEIDDEMFGPKEYLELHRRVSSSYKTLPLKVIWKCIQSFQECSIARSQHTDDEIQENEVVR